MSGMFIVILSAILGLMTVYLWKRLVKDTTAPGHVRWILTAVLLALTVLLLATLVLPRVTGVPEAAWLAWPGYLWLGLLAYLFLTLLVLEPVRLAARAWVKRTRPDAVAAAPATTPEPALSPSLRLR